MPPKNNPLKLTRCNCARSPFCRRSHAFPVRRPGGSQGEITIEQFPNPHGDHFHVGDVVVASKDATGLYNEKVWHALQRKGVARADWPHNLTLTSAGVAYNTGLDDEILHRGAEH